MTIRPTMSRTGLLLQCPWPFDPARGDYEEPESQSRDEARNYGLDFHAAMIGQKKRGGLKIESDILAHAKESERILERWMDRNGWSDPIYVQSREKSYAYHTPSGTSRECGPPREEDHVYPDQVADEICGTLDLERNGPHPTAKARGSRSPRRILVVDYKTGDYESEKFAYPSRLPQLLSNGLAAVTADQSYASDRAAWLDIVSRSEVTLAVLHAPRGITPVLYADPPVSGEHLVREHAPALSKAYRHIREDHGYLRTGPECKYCPAREICPTRGSYLLEKAEQLFGVIALRQSRDLFTANNSGPAEAALARSSPEASEAITPWDIRLGRIYEAKQLAKQTAKAIEDRLREERRAGHLPVLSDGRVLDFRKKSRRNLSMEGLKRQIGKKAAEREIARLEKMGAIETIEYEELVPMHSD